MSLDPNIRALISAFRRQRTAALIVQCALSLGAVVGVATLAAALVDHLFFLSDLSRTILGLFIYLSCFAALFMRHGSQIREKLDARTVARMLESTRPELRGELLSLVELSEQGFLNTNSPDDGHHFVELLHRKTKTSLAAVNHTKLFPVQMLWRDVRVFTLSSLLLVSACILGGSRFRSHCKRVLLPFANIERISDTLITLTAPQPFEGLIPAGEEFLIAADIRNHMDHAAFLEVRRRGQDMKRIPLSRSEMSRFGASFNSQSEPFSYRIQCNDAATRYYHLEPVPRPIVRSFQKQYTFPEYTLLKTKTERSQDGHLKAVAGTQIFLELKSDQSIAGGQILFHDTGDSKNLTLRIDSRDPTKATVTFELKQSGHYQLELVAKDTGFQSRTDLLYEIQADPDLPPDILLEVPSKDIIVPITERVSVAGRVSDDYLITSVCIESRINEEPWNALEISSEKVTSKTLELLIDPVTQNCKVGDVLSVRFTASDSRGQRTESNAVKISLGHSVESAIKNPLLTPQAQIEKQLASLQKQVSEAQQQLSKAAAATQTSNTNALERGQLSAVARRTLENAVQTSNEIRESIRSALAKETDDEPRKDLHLAARALNQLQFALIQPALQSLSRSEAEPAGNSADLQGARDLTSQADSIQKSVHQAIRSNLAYELAVHLSDEANRLAKGRRQLQEQASASNAPALTGSASDAGDDTSGRLNQLNRAEAHELGRATGQLRELSRTASDKLSTMPSRLQGSDSTLEKLQQTLDSTAKSLEEMKPRLSSEASASRAQLERALSSDSANLQRARKEIEEITRRKEIKTERQAALTQAKVESLADLLRADAQLESDRPDAPATLAYSLHQASRALDAIVENNPTPAAATHPIETLEAAMRTLEGAAQLEEAGKAAERASHDPAPGKDHPQASKIAAQLERSLATLPKTLMQAGFTEAILEKSREALAKARDPAAAASLLRDALAGSEELVSKARSAIDALTPSLAEEMKSLSFKSQEGAGKSIELSKGEPNRDAIQKAISAEQRLDAKIENLREALRARANIADFLTEEGRRQSRDADAASSLLQSPERAAQTLQAAAQRLKESKTLLPKAADIQAQTAKKLQQLAQHFGNLEKGDADGAAKSREFLRETEQLTGAKPELDERQAKAEAIGEMAKSLAKEPSPDPASAPKDAAPDAQAQAKPKPNSSADSDQSADSQPNSKQEDKPDSQRSTRAVQAAIDAQKQADRIARAEHSNLSGTSASVSDMRKTAEAEGALPSPIFIGDQNWGRLPKRIATDLMQGRREPISGEYKTAIEDYFRAIAERAQQSAKPVR